MAARLLVVVGICERANERVTGVWECFEDDFEVLERESCRPLGCCFREE